MSITHEHEIHGIKIEKNQAHYLCFHHFMIGAYERARAATARELIRIKLLVIYGTN